MASPRTWESWKQFAGFTQDTTIADAIALRHLRRFPGSCPYAGCDLHPKNSLVTTTTEGDST